MVSFLDIPDVALNYLLKKCDYHSIQVLRKTCWHFRIFIASSNLICLAQVTVNQGVNSMEWKLTSKNETNENPYLQGCGVTYKQVKKGCLLEIRIGGDFKKRFFKNRDFQDMFFTDFKNAMGNLNTHLEEFSVSCRRDGFENFLGELQQFVPIKTNKFGIGFEAGPQLKEMLSLFSPDLLEEIQFSKCASWNFPLSLTEVSELDQWKNAKKLHALSFIMDSSIHHLSGFDNVNLNCKEMTPEMLTALKNVFITSPTDKTFKLLVTFKDANYNELLGNPFIDEKSCPNWFFRSSVTNKYFCIQNDDTLNFKHIDSNDVPYFADVKVE